MKLLNVLEEIARLFNHADVKWAVGGSLLLYFYDILKEPNDIDIIIDPNDKKTVFKILQNIGEEQITREVSNYKTGIFGKFDVKGIEVDIIGDFYIKVNNGYYLHPFRFEALEVIKKNGVKIYLDSVENWSNTYKAMGDPKKRVKLIENYLNNKKRMC